jgi:hypothetical protein
LVGPPRGPPSKWCADREKETPVKLIRFVSYEMFKHFCLQNGVPGAEELTSEFLVFTGSVAGGVVNGAVTQPATQKLNNEYDYYVTEIRLSTSFLNAAAAAIGAQAYIPIVEAQHLSFQLTADGRSRALFRQPIPFASVIQGAFTCPFELPAPPAFSGAETVICTVANLGNYNPQAINAQLDFTIVVQCALIKSVALKQFEQWLKSH